MWDWFSLKDFTFLRNIAVDVLVAIAIVVIGFWLSGKIAKFFYVLMVRRKIEPSIRSFIKEIIHLTLNILVVIMAIANAGLEISSLFAVIGGAAVGIGFGLQGGLSNFAGGVMIVLNKPFLVGDLIEMQGHKGYVERIDMLNTTLRTVNNESVILPNAPVFNQTIKNYSTKGTIRTDVTVGIEYESDYKKLSQLIRKEIRNEPMFSDVYPVVIGIENFDESSIRLTVRAHSKTIHFWEAPIKLNQIIKDTMDANGYTIPFPKRDVTLYNAKDETITEHKLPLSSSETIQS